MGKRNYKGDATRYIVTAILAAVFGFILYWINSIVYGLLPGSSPASIILSSFIYDLITIPLFVGSAILIANKIVGMPKILDSAGVAYLGSGIVTFIALIFWYILVFAFPTIFTTIYLDVLFSVIVALITVRIDSP